MTNGDLSLLFRYGLCTSYLDSITKNIRNEETNNENDAEAKLEDEIQNLRMDETKVYSYKRWCLFCFGCIK